MSQVSTVQALPSSQLRGVLTQLPPLQESTVHALLSLQSIGSNVHTPLHTLVVHASESLQSEFVVHAGTKVA
jgi:hypothetical protein